MLITRDGEIAGLPAVQARDLMRMIRHYAVGRGDLRDGVSKVASSPKVDG